MSSSIPLDNPNYSIGGQQRQQISELQFDKQIPNTVYILMLENQVASCSDFLSEAMLWTKEVQTSQERMN